MSRNFAQMKIALVASNLFPIPPVPPRGPEIVVYNLTQELVKRGHEVTLFASGNSKTDAYLISVTPKDTFSDPLIGLTSRRKYFELALVSKAYSLADKFDLIHIAFGFGGFAIPFVPFVKTPTLVTVHDELTDPYLRKFFSIYFERSEKQGSSGAIAREGSYKNLNNIFFISISDAQRKLLPELPWIKTIYHGIKLDDFRFQGKEGKYLAYLGRLSPRKGVHLAIEAAQKVGLPLKIAGGEEEVNLDYFREKIFPTLDGGTIEYLGEIVSRKQRSAFLRSAKALLFPIHREEPFGLVIVEAMACGTPVIAFNRGSVPEVIKDGETGFIVETVEEMVEAIKKIDQIDRRECRKHVEKNFTVEKMVDGYEEVYREILQRTKK